MYDSVRWGGDETWLMREFGNQVRHGVMAYPDSFSTTPRTDGVLAGSMWFNAVMYGGTGALLSDHRDLVTIGRRVTAFLAVILIFSLYYLLRRLNVHPLLAAGGVALLVIDRGFVLASHSARYDLITGLALIWYCFFLAHRFKAGALTPLLSFVSGIVCVAVIIFSRHMLTLTLPVTLLYLLSYRIWRDRRALLLWISGSLLAGIILSLSYWRGSEELSLFGRGGNMGSFSFVLGQIPILRPFSRNVQVSNLLERIHLIQSDIPGLLVTIVVALLLFLTYKAWQWKLRRSGTRLKIATTPEQRFMLGASIVCSISWLLLQGSRPYYLFHVVPLLIISGCIVLQLWLDVFQNRVVGPALITIILLVALILQIPDAIPSTTLGTAVARDQKSAIHKLLDATPSHSNPKSRILVDVAGLDWALTDTTRSILSLDLFQPPANATEAVDKLRSQHIDFVILRSSPVGGPFEPGRALLPHVLDSIGVVRDSALGFFYDDGRSYDASLSTLIDQGLDTLWLYQVGWGSPSDARR